MLTGQFFFFFAFFVVCQFFSKSTFLKNSFGNTIKVSTSVDPDQTVHFDEPDLGPNCLQRLSADDTTCSKVSVFGKVNSGEDLSSFLPNGIYEFLSVSQSKP